MQSCALEDQCAALSLGAASDAATTIVQTFLMLFCQMSTSNPWPKNHGEDFIRNHNLDSYDFIVVGAGAAGPVIAGRLSEIADKQVLIIEAGDDPPMESEIPGFQKPLFESNFNWNYPTKTNNKSCLIQPNGSLPWPRGKMLGGSCGLNAMFYVRGNRRDFDSWAKFGNPGWDWDSVLEDYKTIENYKADDPHGIHGHDGPIVITKLPINQEIPDIVRNASLELGHADVGHYRDGHNLGYFQLDATSENGTRTTPAKAFLQMLKPNLHVVKNAVVTKINFDENRKASSVDFVYTDKKKRKHELRAHTKKEIIVSAGSIESPKLLMLSGIGPKDHLKSLNIPVIADLPVGNNLQEHPQIWAFFKTNRTQPSIPESLYEFFMYRRGRLTTLTPSDGNVFMDIGNKSSEYPNMQILLGWFPTIPWAQIRPLPGQTLEDLEKPGEYLMMFLLMQQPKSKGWIRLASIDYQDKPIIYPNYLDEYEDVKLYIETLREVKKYEDTPTFKKHGIKFARFVIEPCSYLTYDTDEYWECYIRYTISTTFHPAGTVKMGPAMDPEAVVDSELNVRGVRGLRVADSSIMPFVVSSNTMAATIMIGEKASKIIKKEWKFAAKKHCRMTCS